MTAAAAPVEELATGYAPPGERRRAMACALDVSDADAVEHAAARIEAELGPIDVWVNNAMTATLPSCTRPRRRTSAASWR
jgi:NAD(P)-dependent dehydrogenase (short-subunit alcohol dehydrogenase family)